MTPNKTTPEGRRLGGIIGRLCDKELAGHPDNRCLTCAFRPGDHLPNGSPETLMTAVKCLAERSPFWCHEADKPCAGWLALRFPKDQTVKMPWDFCEGSDLPDVIALPDLSADPDQQKD